MLETSQTFKKQDSAAPVFRETIRLSKVFVQKISERFLPIYASK